MELTIKEEKVFPPITLEIKVETLEELKVLGALFNRSVNDIQEDSEDTFDDGYITKDVVASVTNNLWEILVPKMEDRGLKW